MRSFIPNYLLDRLAEADDERVARCVTRTREVDAAIRERRTALAASPTSGGLWAVHDADNGTELPGRLVRSEGEPETGDAAVDEAAAGLGATQQLFADWGRDSYDGAGATAVATVHFGEDYVNAFWDGTQLVFGDGDGVVFDRFTKPVDVLAHELAHALVTATADLAYEDQSGALNESVADVVGACVKQRVLGQGAAEADWIVGEGIFLPGVQGRGLRSMIEPGTAYDDPRLGQDPQPGHLDDYVVTDDDNGGVHVNSGIPNRAFALAARAVGGESWSGAGRIWYDALLTVGPRTDFAGFAAATVAAAGDHAAAVTEAWQQVGVTPGAAPTAPTPEPAPPATVSVRRTGGVAGMVREARLDLTSDDDPRVPQVRELVERVDLRAAAAASSGPAPDRFVYAIQVGETQVRVGEQDLTGDLASLTRLLLDD